MEMANETAPVMVLGDVHGDIGWMRDACNTAASHGVQTIIQVGDFAWNWPGRGKLKFGNRVEQFLAERSLRLILVDGNHDNHAELRRLPLDADGFGIMSGHMRYAPRGHRWTVHGTRFGALGGAFSIDREWRVLDNSYWLEETTTLEDVARLGTEPLDVLVTHEAPAGIALKVGGKLPQEIEWEAWENRKLVAQAVANTGPSLVFCGHWYQRATQALHHGSTRVEVLGMNGDRDGAGVLLHLTPAPSAAVRARPRVAPVRIMGT